MLLRAPFQEFNLNVGLHGKKKLNGYEGFFKHEITSEVDIDPLK